MSSRKDVERQFEELKGFRATVKEFDRQMQRDIEALKRIIKAQIKDEEITSKMYFELSKKAEFVGEGISSDLYRISGEEFAHKSKLEQIYRKLGGKI